MLVLRELEVDVVVLVLREREIDVAGVEAVRALRELEVDVDRLVAVRVLRELEDDVARLVAERILRELEVDELAGELSLEMGSYIVLPTRGSLLNGSGASISIFVLPHLPSSHP